MVEFVDKKFLDHVLRPEQYVEIIDFEQLKKNNQKAVLPQRLHLPVDMLKPYKDRIFEQYGRTLAGLALYRGLTIGEAWNLLHALDIPDPKDDNERIACVKDIVRKLREWLDLKETLNNAPLPSPTHQPVMIDIGISDEELRALQLEINAENPPRPPRPPSIFTTEELIEAIDVPGFCWDNLSNAEQRNLSSSLFGFVSDLLKRNKESSEDKVATLFEAIKHGDEDHQAWLSAAIAAHFAGAQIPNYVEGKSEKQELRVQLRDWTSRTEWYTRQGDSVPEAPTRRKSDTRHVADLMREEILHLRGLICTLPKLVLLGWYINWPPHEIGYTRFLGVEAWQLKESLERTKPGVSFVEHWGEEKHKPASGPTPWPTMHISHYELVDDEPHFILKGRDPQAPGLIEQWTNVRAMANPEHKHKVQSAKQIASAMREFKENNPNLGLSSQAYEDAILTIYIDN